MTFKKEDKEYDSTKNSSKKVVEISSLTLQFLSLQPIWKSYPRTINIGQRIRQKFKYTPTFLSFSSYLFMHKCVLFVKLVFLIKAQSTYINNATTIIDFRVEITYSMGYFLSYSCIRLHLRLALFVNLREFRSSVVTESSITWNIVSISITGSNDNERNIGNVSIIVGLSIIICKREDLLMHVRTYTVYAILLKNREEVEKRAKK